MLPKPLDQFRPFVALRKKGQGDKEIATAFFLARQILKHRLNLASVTPALLEICAADGITLEQLMAFTVNADHDRLVQVWDMINPTWNKELFHIRHMLTETSIRASDRRAVFVGVNAHEAASGPMLHDLFQGDDGDWLEVPALLNRLVTEKLQAAAETVSAEGWKRVEVSLDPPYDYSHGRRILSEDPTPMTDDKTAVHAKLLTNYRALEEEYSGQDEFPKEIDTHPGELEQAMEKLENRPLVFEQTEIARAGVFVTLNRYGALAVYCGYARPDDELRTETVVQDGVDPTLAGQGNDLAAAVILVQMSGPSLHRVVSPLGLVWKMRRRMDR